MTILDFKQRLLETIEWCSMQKLVCEPVEEESVQRRRKICSEGVELLTQGHNALKEAKDPNFLARWWARRKIPQAHMKLRRGNRLIATARVGEILPPLRTQLRSGKLSPLTKDFGVEATNTHAIVDQVSKARAQILRDLNSYPQTADANLRGGRLLLYAPSDNVADGASEYASFGFFDLYDSPPWDTWIAMYGKYLVSWVPPQLLSLAEQGIKTNPVESILWADDASLRNEKIATVIKESISVG